MLSDYGSGCMYLCSTPSPYGGSWRDTGCNAPQVRGVLDGKIFLWHQGKIFRMNGTGNMGGRNPSETLSLAILSQQPQAFQWASICYRKKAGISESERPIFSPS